MSFLQLHLNWDLLLIYFLWRQEKNFILHVLLHKVRNQCSSSGTCTEYVSVDSVSYGRQLNTVEYMCILILHSTEN